MTNAIVVLSGGQDSTLCTAIALQECDRVHAVIFDYGQRHSIEIESAVAVANALEIQHEVVKCPGILHSVSPLTSNNEVEQYRSPDELPGGIASTFVPLRNLFFLTIAANRAIELGCDRIYTGLCQTDFSGYPDCRQGFVDSVEETIYQATEQKLLIVTPLMDLTKADSVKLAQQVMGDRFGEIISLTHTCYNGIKGGCSQCAACLLRDRGFREAGINDPIWQFR